MIKNILISISFLLLAVSCGNQNHNVDFLNIPMALSESIVLTKNPGIYQSLDSSYKNGYSLFYLIRKKGMVNSQEWTDLSAYEDYLKHKSFEELSSDFDIYLYFIDKDFLVKESFWSNNYIQKIPRTTCFYFLDFPKKRVVEIGRFDIKNEEEDRKCQIWLSDFINNKGREVEEEVESKALCWVNNNSLLDNYSLNNLESKETLRQIQWFDIPEIFKKSPLDMNNISIYNDAAVFLIKNEMYNEARIILLEITKKYPEKEEEWLALGDAQWGNGDEEDARESYNVYLNLMKKNSGKLAQIPKRVYERVH